MLWENLREEEFPAAIERSGGLCVIPLGCVEKHGEHLPVGTDSIWGAAVAQRAAELADVVVFPCAPWLGDVVSCHAVTEPWKTHVQGYVSINPHTLLTVLEELCDEIARNGFRKILLTNSHGGNVPLLNYFMRCQTYRQLDYATLWTGAGAPVFDPAQLYELLTARRGEFPDLTDGDMAVLARYAETGHGGIHANFEETVLVQGVRPETVAPDRFGAVDGLSTHRADYLAQAKIQSGFGWGANYPNAFCGTAPLGASEAIGRACVQLAAEHLAAKLKLLKEDEDCVRMARGLPPEQ